MICSLSKAAWQNFVEDVKAQEAQALALEDVEKSEEKKEESKSFRPLRMT